MVRARRVRLVASLQLDPRRGPLTSCQAPSDQEAGQPHPAVAPSSGVSGCVSVLGCHTKHHTHRSASSRVQRPKVWNPGVGGTLLPRKAPREKPSQASVRGSAVPGGSWDAWFCRGFTLISASILTWPSPCV